MVVLFALKLWLYNVGLNISNTDLGKYFDKLVRVYFVPDSVPAWQWASVINAGLTFGAYLYADKLLRGDSEAVAPVRTLKVVSGLLSLYTIAVLIRVTYLEADIRIPPLGDWWPG